MEPQPIQPGPMQAAYDLRGGVGEVSYLRYRSRAAHRGEPWLGPAFDEVARPALLLAEVQTASLLLSFGSVLVYEAGFEFTLSFRSLIGTMNDRIEGGSALLQRSSAPIVTIEYPNGRVAATNDGDLVAAIDEQRAPLGPTVMTFLAEAVDEDRLGMYWVWPLPENGELLLRVRSEIAGLRTTIALPAGHLLEAHDPLLLPITVDG